MNSASAMAAAAIWIAPPGHRSSPLVHHHKGAASAMAALSGLGDDARTQIGDDCGEQRGDQPAGEDPEERSVHDRML